MEKGDKLIKIVETATLVQVGLIKLMRSETAIHLPNQCLFGIGGRRGAESENFNEIVTAVLEKEESLKNENLSKALNHTKAFSYLREKF